MSWLPRKWIAGGILVAGAVFGLFVADRGAEPWHYAAGLYLSGLCVLAVFALISTAWGPSPLGRLDPFPRNGAERWAHGGIVGAIGVLGLFHASAAPVDSLAHKAGLVLFLIAIGYAFLLLKDWFDRYYASSRSR